MGWDGIGEVRGGCVQLTAHSAGGGWRRVLVEGLGRGEGLWRDSGGEEVSGGWDREDMGRGDGRLGGRHTWRGDICSYC